jgi:daunorubicin resistance ABC transporter ATP-binding subunit
MIAIEVHGLRKTYPGGIEAVNGIDFDVSTGEVFGLLGPNGAGKSSTIGMLTTTLAPTAGRARVVGYDVVTQARSVRGASSVVFQEAVVDRVLTGRRNLLLHARLWGVDRALAERRITEHADAFGLADLLDRPVAGYSGGQRRRLEIARALLPQPQVLFLDEPTVGLDPRIRHELLDVIDGLRHDRGMTIMLTTHYLDEAERLCDRVAIVHEGNIVALDTPASLRREFGDQLVELRLAGGAAAALIALRQRRAVPPNAFAVGTTITVPLRDTSRQHVLDAIDALGLEPLAVTTRQPTLDDVYLRLTGSTLAA